QPHQPRDFTRRPLPVVRREGVQREDPDAEIGCGLDDLLDHPGALPVAEDPWLPSGNGPAAVPVHDHADVNALEAAFFHKVNSRGKTPVVAREPTRSAPPCDRGT